MLRHGEHKDHQIQISSQEILGRDEAAVPPPTGFMFDSVAEGGAIAAVRTNEAAADPDEPCGKIAELVLLI